jgi:prepilin-type N-terminal cleavage/methylation domain-containing protein
MSHFIARRGFTLVELFVVIVVIGFLLCLLVPALVNTGAREAGRRAACINTMKQLGLALHNFHDARKRFPASSTQPLLSATAPAPGSGNADGNGAGYSWQTMLLPFVEENNLYQKLNVVDGYPYDASAAHAPVAAMPISAFRCASFNGGEFAQAPEYPKDSSALGNYVAIGATHLASLYGTETRPIGGKNHPNGVLYPGSKTCFKDIKDGSSNTVVLTETKEENYSAWIDGTTAAVVGLLASSQPKFALDPTGKYYVPDNRTLTTLNCGDNKDPATNRYLAADKHSGSQDWVHGPSSCHPSVVNHLLGDGSVRSVSDGIDATLYMHLITRDGGEPVNEFHNQ